MQRRASGRNTSVGQGQVVDEMVIRFTHSVRMDWLLPGIPPTGKRVVQIGLLDRTLPVRGAEIAAQVLSPAQPMNALIPRGGVREASRDAGTRRNGGASSSAA